MIAAVRHPGAELIRASWAGTVVLAIAAVGAVASPGTGLAVPLVFVALLMLLGGSAAMVWAYALAVRRSRTDEIAVAGLYFLAAGAAPNDVRRSLMASLAAQCVIGFAAAAARPFTAAAFGILAPVWGLGLTGVWAARHGTYPRRRPEPGGRKGRAHR
jgi:hypothetical protein